jgi:hypothetical protein
LSEIPKSQNVPLRQSDFCTGTGHDAARSPLDACEEAMMGRGILLWLIGVPIPVIILLWLFFGG